MRLDNDVILFKQYIGECSDSLGVLKTYVEKDYWLYLILKEIFRNNENGYIFKGGTSLSKCFHLIDRFSEDIDISYSTSYDDLTIGGMRKKLRAIVEAIEKVGFTIVNKDNLRSRRYFNQLLCPYDSVAQDEKTDISKQVIVELAAQTPSFPSEAKRFSSFIGDYLESINRHDLLIKYELEPFVLQVQTLERTLVDKTFAICDYYLDDKCIRHSRHIYDIAKLLTEVKLDNNLADLFKQVRSYRNKIPICISAKEGIKLNELMAKIIAYQSFKKDYNHSTYQLLYEDYPYHKCEEALIKLKDFLIDNNL